MPLRAVWILAIGMACLLVHFYAENLPPSAQPFGMEWIDSREADGQNHASVEELFILPENIGLNILQNSIRIVCPEVLVLTSLPFTPLLPPPIAG